MSTFILRQSEEGAKIASLDQGESGFALI